MLNLTSALAKRKEWLAKLRLRASFERSFVSSLKAEFNRVAAEAKHAYLTRSDFHAIYAEHRKRLTALFENMYAGIMTTFAKRLLARKPKAKCLALAGSYELKWTQGWEELEAKDTEQQIAKRVKLFAQKNAAKNVQNISATTEARINKIIQKGVANATAPSAVAEEIEEKTGGEIGDFRARVIARTETHTAANAGDLEAAKESGVVVSKEWVSTNDTRTRDGGKDGEGPDHVSMNGVTVGMEEAFSVPGGDGGDDEMQYPGDPAGSAGNVINCRCVLVYNTADETPDLALDEG